ncbi:pantoate--beta-alanine ligase [Verrucomicrobiaceae bacterium R5-34]|uniref:Pantothenate synthetase n=1 Tax=Oceaniferula flava TaxID=2800421 RepID=A0AAE2VF41_9BACT|nr:pantoate--beta-alanine ligase [Oceaniferula flavus]MBK1830621.1 pantoate--beta-alanine ligase [Verrucomicrobiaceae bacterium R5-34]MBK1856574.1 pantoate--beta-alanine ligase [Oceaniferula flavus]MBM1137881.1 pantoate--beta-alanine ligase [Oceaniferula flavus]
MNIITEPTEIPHSAERSPRVLVPTMGALHDGHLTLVKRARELAGDDGEVLLTLFVNPTQFNNPSDLENYPRTMERDLELCREHGVDLVFAPKDGSMYHPDHSVNVTEDALSSRLCGATRPGHFAGVCTVVLKLFNLTGSDIAVFGKKDFQQLAIIRRMVRDLNVPIVIEGVDTVREASGLAMSSRNVRLSEAQRNDAPRIRKALLTAQQAFHHGETRPDQLLDMARQTIEASDACAVIDYLELLDAENLQPLEKVTRPAIIATAVFYGEVRLIDNIELDAE